MKKLLAGALLSLSVFAQESVTSNQFTQYKILNSNYGGEEIELTCHSEDCSRVSVVSHGVRKSLNKTIDMERVRKEANKSIGTVTGLNCADGHGGSRVGAPCFGAVRTMTSGAKKSFKEGRPLVGALKTVMAPAGLAIDLIFTATVILPLAMNEEHGYVNRVDVETTRRERRYYRRVLKRQKYIMDKLSQSSEDGVLEVNDRIFDKISRKLRRM